MLTAYILVRGVEECHKSGCGLSGLFGLRPWTKTVVDSLLRTADRTHATQVNMGGSTSKSSRIWKYSLNVLKTAILVGPLGIPVCLPFILGSVAALDLRWPELWGVSIAQFLTSCVIGYQFNQVNGELLKEREKGTAAPGTKWWDKVLVVFYAVATNYMYVATGLDRRWNGTTLLISRIPAYALVLAYAVEVLALMWVGWAMCENKWFSSVVRIQSDRSHRVCSSGPYSYVRHPGYTGAIVQTIAEIIIFNSTWTATVAAVKCSVLTYRTALEDSTLRRELDGYDKYSADVRYRLLPGVW